MDTWIEKTLNAVYLRSGLVMLRYPLSESEAKSLDQKAVETLIGSGDLVIAKRPVSRSLSVDVLRVTDQGAAKVSPKTKWYLRQRQDKAKLRAKRNRRMTDVDHYKHERNPFMGSRLRRGGGKTICTQCHAVNKPCKHGDAFLKSLPVDARPPKANASKTRWNAFCERFGI